MNKKVRCNYYQNHPKTMTNILQRDHHCLILDRYSLENEGHLFNL